MATYTVKAPDGKTVTLKGPDGASQADIIAQAQRLYQPQAAKPAKAPNARTTKFAAAGSQEAGRALQAAETAFLRRFEGKPEGVRMKALARFRANPQLQTLRKSAGLAEVSTRESDIRAVARQNIEKFRKAREATGMDTGDFGESFASSVANTFGIGPRLASAGQYLKDRLTGEDADYQRSLDIAKEENRILRESSTAGDIAGMVAGGALGGGGAGLAVRGLGRAVASKGATGAGNFLQNITRLEQGRKAANTAKILGSGTVAGAAQALGEDENVGTGALYGAGGAAAVGGAIKAGSILLRPFGDMLRMSNAESLLRRFTKVPPAELAARAARHRQDTGAEPTIFEILPLADRNRLMSRVIQGQDGVVEQTQEAIGRRAGNVGSEMRASTSRAVRPQRNAARRAILGDLRAAGEDAPIGADARTAVAASDSQLDMQLLRREEARRIMAPFDENQVVESFGDLLPSTPVMEGSTVRMVPSDPEVTRMLQSVAGILRGRTPDSPNGITVADITHMITELGDDVGKGGPEGRAAQQAIEHLRDVMSENVPEAADAASRMTDAFAARSRMLEGMGAGFGEGLRGNVQVGTRTQQARKAVNAFDTAEGATGRSLGQINKLTDQLSGTPDEALRAASNIARGGATRELRQNIGREPADELIRAAQAQERSAGVLAQAMQSLQRQGAEHMDADAVVSVMTALHPASFVTTKASALRRLMDMSYVPESRARVMVDMLFSQDRNVTNRVIQALQRDRKGLTFLGTLPGIIAATNREGGTDTADFSPTEELPEDAVAEDIEIDQEAPEGVPYGRAVIEDIFPAAQITDDIRDPNSDLGQANPNSYHVQSDGAVDLRPIPGMTFDEFVAQIKNAGYEILEAIDETKNPSAHATGPHWHVVLA